MVRQFPQHYHQIEKLFEFLIYHQKQTVDYNTMLEAVSIEKPMLQKLCMDWAGVDFETLCSAVGVDFQQTNSKQNLLKILRDTVPNKPFITNEKRVKIYPITPEERLTEKHPLTISYSFYNSVFGETFIAATPQGICRLSFDNNRDAALTELQQSFPNATCVEQNNWLHQLALQAMRHPCDRSLPVLPLHVKGSNFQLRVWRQLLKIPVGDVITYGDVACRMNKPGASRVVGNAAGSNPVAYFIPCHRVVLSSGALGGFRWGFVRKLAIIAWERATCFNSEHNEHDLSDTGHSIVQIEAIDREIQLQKKKNLRDV